MLEIFILATAMFGFIQLLISLRMVYICAKICQTFYKANYSKLTITQLVSKTKFNEDDIMRACVSDNRFERATIGSFNVWIVGKQWRIA